MSRSCILSEAFGALGYVDDDAFSITQQFRWCGGSGTSSVRRTAVLFFIYSSVLGDQHSASIKIVTQRHIQVNINVRSTGFYLLWGTEARCGGGEAEACSVQELPVKDLKHEKTDQQYLLYYGRCIDL